MKKRFMTEKMTALLLAGMIGAAGLFTGCGAAKDAATQEAADAQDTAADAAEGTEADGEANAVGAVNAQPNPGTKNADGSVTYANDYLEITVPADLAPLVEAESTADRIDLYHKESKEAGFGGHVFCVWAVEVPREYAGGPYMKVGEISNEDAHILDVVQGFATEFQWDPELEEEPEDFVKLDEADEGILAGIKGINGYTYIHGAGTKGEDLYNTALARIVTAVKEGWDANRLEQEGISPEFNAESLGENALDQIGFAYADNNADGIDELFVGLIADGEGKGVVYDIYTMVDSRPALVVSGSARNRYYNFGDAFIANEWSGGAGEYGYGVYGLEANSTELVYQWGHKYDSYENEKEPWFKTYDGENYEAVSEKEFEEAYQRLSDNYVRFDFTPLSKDEDAIALAEYEGVTNGQE